MKVHLVLMPPEIIISHGIETSVIRRKSGYTLYAFTLHKMPDRGLRQREFACGMVDLDVFEAEWISGRILTISPAEPLARAIRWLMHR